MKFAQSKACSRGRAVSDVCAGSSVLMNTWLHATRLSNPSSGEAPASPANSNRSILTNIHHASTSALQGAHALLAHEKLRAFAELLLRIGIGRPKHHMRLNNARSAGRGKQCGRLQLQDSCAPPRQATDWIWGLVARKEGTYVVGTCVHAIAPTLISCRGDI